jgi:hypothetical protein
MQPKDPNIKHFYISLLKSCVRIAAGILAMVYTSDLAVSLLAAGIVVAEMLGIAEEL